MSAPNLFFVEKAPARRGSHNKSPALFYGQALASAIVPKITPLPPPPSPSPQRQRPKNAVNVAHPPFLLRAQYYGILMDQFVKHVS